MANQQQQRVQGYGNYLGMQGYNVAGVAQGASGRPSYSERLWSRQLLASFDWGGCLSSSRCPGFSTWFVLY